MIITLDKNFPLVIMIVDNFNKLEYKTFIKNINYYNNIGICENCNIKLYIDLYNLKDYSLSYLNELLSYLNGKKLAKITSVKIFFNKFNTSYILKAFAYLNNYNTGTAQIDIIDLDKPKKWY